MFHSQRLRRGQSVSEMHIYKARERHYTALTDISSDSIFVLWHSISNDFLTSHAQTMQSTVMQFCQSDLQYQNNLLVQSIPVRTTFRSTVTIRTRGLNDLEKAAPNDPHTVKLSWAMWHTDRLMDTTHIGNNSLHLCIRCSLTTLAVVKLWTKLLKHVRLQQCHDIHFT